MLQRDTRRSATHGAHSDLPQKINAIGSRRQDHDKADAAYIAERIFKSVGPGAEEVRAVRRMVAGQPHRENHRHSHQLVNEASRGLFNKDVVETDI
jgi:hypothetical protein